MKHALFPLIWVIGSIVLALEYSPFRYGILIAACWMMLTIVHAMDDPFAPQIEKPKDPKQLEPYSWMT